MQIREIEVLDRHAKMRQFEIAMPRLEFGITKTKLQVLNLFSPRACPSASRQSRSRDQHRDPFVTAVQNSWLLLCLLLRLLCNNEQENALTLSSPSACLCVCACNASLTARRMLSLITSTTISIPPLVIQTFSSPARTRPLSTQRPLSPSVPSFDLHCTRHDSHHQIVYLAQRSFLPQSKSQ